MRPLLLLSHLRATVFHEIQQIHYFAVSYDGNLIDDFNLVDFNFLVWSNYLEDNFLEWQLLRVTSG